MKPRILEEANDGDHRAWAAVIERFQGLVWSVASAFRLGSQTDDVVQLVWLRLVENIDRIRDRDTLPAWLAATTRQEAQRMAMTRRWEVSVREFPEASDGSVLSPEEVVVDQDMVAHILDAFRQLPEHDQHLLRLLCRVPPLSYKAIAVELERPIASIGPHRARVLRKLQRMLLEINAAGAVIAQSAGDISVKGEISGEAAQAVVMESFADGWAQRLPAGLEGATKAVLVGIGRHAGRQAAAALAWQSRVGDIMDTEQVTLLLGISRQALDSRKRTGSVLALPGAGTTHYPTWQFDTNGARATVRPITVRIVTAFREAINDVSPFTIAAWATSPQPELNGRTPADWILRNGSDEPVVCSAQRTALLEAL